MAMQPRNRLLTFNDPHPMRIDRDLAAEIGLNESIVLLQLEYLISISSNERDGHTWTYQSLTDLKEVYFPWWSLMTIQRTIKNLEEKRLIVIGNFNKLGYDRTQWYALNEAGINELHSIAIYQNDKSIYQNGEMDHNKMINGSYQNDTTIPESTHEITQNIHGGSARAKKRAAPPTQVSLSQLSEAVQIYKELAGIRTLTPVVADKIADTVTDIPHWRAVITAWLEWGYNPKSCTGLLDWYSHPEKIRQSKGEGYGNRNRSVRSHSRQPVERAQWRESTDDEPA